MELAHARDDGLPRLLIRIGAEGGVLFAELLKRRHHLFLTCLGLRFDRDLNDRRREDHAFQKHLAVFRAERVAGRRFLHADQRADVARMDFIELGARIRVHQKDLADALALLLRDVIDVGTGF